MKKLLFLFVMIIGHNAMANPIIFNDSVFENYCITNFDNNNNGVVEDFEVANIIALNIPSMNISNLTGIEYFTGLRILHAYNNNLTSINLSNSIYLEYLSLENNQLSTINLSTLINLDVLYLGNNNLTSLDISDSINLRFVSAFLNSISSIDLSNLSQLLSLKLDYNQLSSLDLSANNDIKWLYVEGNLLTELGTSNLSDLKYCRATGNFFSRLDFSQNSQLREIRLNSNPNLQIVNVMNNTNHLLGTFSAVNCPNLLCVKVDNPEDASIGAGVYGNWQAPANFDYSACPYTYVPDDAFEQYIINTTPETGPIDDYVLTASISSVAGLSAFYIQINDFTGLEDFTNLSLFIADNVPANAIDFAGNSNLKILVLNQCQGLTSIDVRQQFNPDLERITILNSHTLTSLQLMDFSNLESVTVDNCSQFENIELNNNVNLKEITLRDLQLQNFAMLGNVQIEHITADNVQLNALDVSSLGQLESLSIPNNNLVEIDVSNNTFLSNIDVRNNDLEYANVANGFNQNLTVFNFVDNSSLECIQVDDPMAVINQVQYPYDIWEKDHFANYSDYCKYPFEVEGNDGEESMDYENRLNTSEKHLDILIYPNPSKGLFSIENLNSQKWTYTISNMNGIVFQNGKLNEYERDLNLQLKSGIYVVVFTNEANRLVKRLIVE